MSNHASLFSETDKGAVPSPTCSPEQSAGDSILTQCDDSQSRKTTQEHEPGQKGRKRVKKMVSKTFVNDEGYMGRLNRCFSENFSV